MSLLKRWHEKAFQLAGQPIALKLKCLSFAEAPPFLAKMHEFGKATQALREAPDSTGSIFTMLDPQWVGEVFERWVRPAAPIETDDGGAIETGRGVFDAANPGLVLAVLSELASLAVLTGLEGKDSGSPSTSSAAIPIALAAGGSPATSTEPEGGPSL